MNEKKKCFKPQLTGRQTRIELEAMRRNPVSSRVTSLTREPRLQIQYPNYSAPMPPLDLLSIEWLFHKPFNKCYQCDHDLSMIIVLFWSLISGTAGDSFSYHDGQSFTTKDRDNDLRGELNCGEVCKGGWWYKDCWLSNLNGYYRRGTYQPENGCYDGVSWFGWKGYDYSLKRTEMKIRPVSF